MTQSDNPIVSKILEIFGEPVPFKPSAYYDCAGDCIEFMFSNEMFFARRLDGWVTVYLSEKTGKIVGGLIKGVKQNLLKKHPGICIEIHEDSQIKVSCLLRAQAWATSDTIKLQTYKDMLDQCGELNAELQCA